MKHRILALILSILLAALPMLACSDSNVNSDESANIETGANPGAETVDAEPDEPTAADTIKERYASTNLNGYVYKVLAIPTDGHFYSQVAAGINEVYAEEINGEIINDAIFNRNASAEALLNMTIEPIWGSNVDTIRTQVHNEVLAGTTEYDTVLNRMDFIGTNMYNGDLLNIKNIGTIDTDDYWWDRNIVDAFTLFGNKLYWLAGDLNIYDDFAAEVIFFNKKLCQDNNMEYPYGEVLAGTWTIDKFYQMAHTAEKDLNGDGKLMVGKDVVGHCEENDHVKHWIYAMGEKSLNIGEDGSLEVCLTNERQIRAIDTLYSYMVDRSMTYTGNSGAFKQDLILFLGTMLGPIGGLRDMESEFGVLPMPKLDEAQEHYGEYISNGWCTAYGIPMTNVHKADQIGIILDAICAFSHETLRYALYDVLFGAKFVRDPESVQMLDIIFESKAYDWAVDFSWGGGFQNCYNGIYDGKQNNFTSQTKSAMKMINKQLEKLMTTIKEMEY
ncbi:MAG: hypothetical protein IKQ92_05380 [Clostridia bacterium]|nr:hypothetical protein [Clostridia bacterium]